ncbi:hypothetical protein F4X88_07455 [Candidatus Poribacteria bacterium]|nr:hypothetical protein [Candidatus Poribacteria bacterium]MYA56113.1 hypothetical protein [Candidatus Poribacteria bacterium]
MELQQLIYCEALKLVEEAGLCIEEHKKDLYVTLRELSQWIDESGRKDHTLKRFIKDCPEYGFQVTRSKWLIRIKYLPYLVSRFGIGRITDKKVRDKIREILERFGFLIPEHPPHRVYFITFRGKRDQKKYCKVGITSTAMETRFNSVRQQIRSLTMEDSLEILGEIETDDAASLESLIKEQFASVRADTFIGSSTVGKKEIYELNRELYQFIKSNSTISQKASG